LSRPLLLIVNLSSKGEAFPIQALKEVDSALATAGFKKGVHSVVVPGKEFSVTFEGPSMERNRIEEILKPMAEQNQIGFSVEVEESVRFP
jgi:ribosomal protein S9